MAACLRDCDAALAALEAATAAPAQGDPSIDDMEPAAAVSLVKLRLRRAEALRRLGRHEDALQELGVLRTLATSDQEMAAADYLGTQIRDGL